MKKETVNKILNETEAGYDLVASKFSETRKHFWQDLEFIKDYAQEGDKILDFGCGNGRLLELFDKKEIEYYGLDTSQKLIDLAKSKYANSAVKFLKIPGQDSLPFPNDYFNVIYSIAVFHHLPGKDLRKELARELYRVLKPGGKIIITVWNLWQPHYSTKVAENWARKILGRNDLDWNDCYIGFKNNQGESFRRYHHAFRRRELKSLFVQAGFHPRVSRIMGGRNILFIGQK